VGVFVVGGVVGGVVSGAIVGTSSSSATDGSTVTACPVTTVARQVMPSMVTISASGPGGGGTGSGEVIRSDGYILTNNHVISVAAAAGGSVDVQFADGETVPATIKGRDPQRDLAVLKVETSRRLQPIAMGSSPSVQVGQPVVAIGSPLGWTGTVTSGIVSALDRTVQVPGEDDRSALLVDAVQTDASINPGNSGGALVDCAHRLIGVPTAGATVPSPTGQSAGGSIGLGFAIPVDLAKTIADEIIATGRVTNAFIGLQTVPISPAGGPPVGLFVQAVSSGSPAAAAGLRRQDVITSIDGAAATNNIQLAELTLTKSPGDTVSLGYDRAGHSSHVVVTLAAQP